MCMSGEKENQAPSKISLCTYNTYAWWWSLSTIQYCRMPQVSSAFLLKAVHSGVHQEEIMGAVTPTPVLIRCQSSRVQ